MIVTPPEAKPGTEHLNEPVLPFARRDFDTLSSDMTVEEALTAIRHSSEESLRPIRGDPLLFRQVDGEAGTAGIFAVRGGRSPAPLVLHMSGAALCGLMAIGIAAGSPEDAGKEDGNDNWNDDQWRSDVHAKFSVLLDYQKPIEVQRTPWCLPSYLIQSVCT